MTRTGHRHTHTHKHTAWRWSWWSISRHRRRVFNSALDRVRIVFVRWWRRLFRSDLGVPQCKGARTRIVATTDLGLMQLHTHTYTNDNSRACGASAYAWKIVCCVCASIYNWMDNDDWENGEHLRSQRVWMWVWLCLWLWLCVSEHTFTFTIDAMVKSRHTHTHSYNTSTLHNHVAVECTRAGATTRVYTARELHDDVIWQFGSIIS